MGRDNKLREKVAPLAAALAFALALGGCAKADAPEAAGERACYAVTRVVDGDTFKIDVGGGRDDTVRMQGIDTPETVKPNAPVEPYGKEASDFAKRILTNETVCLETDVAERDRYDRLLAYVYLEDGTFVNEWLVAEGYATVLTIAPNVRFADRLVAAQREAREAGRGLWAGGADGAAMSEAPAEAPASMPSEPDRDCGDFATAAEAQAFFEAAGGPARDPHRLDGDKDGLACESP